MSGTRREPKTSLFEPQQQQQQQLRPFTLAVGLLVALLLLLWREQGIVQTYFSSLCFANLDVVSSSSGNHQLDNDDSIENDSNNNLNEASLPASFDIYVSNNDSSSRSSSSLPQSSPSTFSSSFQSSSSASSIRLWGCHRTETPLIFVHVGKMGGGSVRARFAAAALNYTRGNDDWRNSQDSTAYYDIVDNDNSNDNRTSLTSSSSSSRAYFCNSKLPNYRYYHENRTYEGTLPCRALTPLGQAVACPGVSFDACLGCPLQQKNNNNNIDDTADASCHRVYVGHNLLGNEIHHLPPQWLAQWWQAQQQPQQGGNTSHAQQQQQQQHEYHAKISTYMKRIQVDSTTTDPSWCTTERVGRPQTPRQALQYHTKCSIPLAQSVDELATQWIQSVSSVMTTQSLSSSVEQPQQQESPTASSSLRLSPPLPFDTSIHWGALYASLPLLRTTVVREPFSWFLSKFAWHGHGRSYACDNVTAATFRTHLYREQVEVGGGNSTWYPETRARGWAHRHAMGYILHLCGEDCNIRYAHAQAQLGTNFRESHERALIESFLRQADYNLRHSIAVVGLQDDMDGFYDMVTARVQYMNMSRNSHVEGPRHASAATDECRDTFASPAFRRTLMDASPAIVAAVRLYETAVRVHAFQRQELQACSSSR